MSCCCWFLNEPFLLLLLVYLNWFELRENNRLGLWTCVFVTCTSFFHFNLTVWCFWWRSSQNIRVSRSWLDLTFKFSCIYFPQFFLKILFSFFCQHRSYISLPFHVNKMSMLLLSASLHTLFFIRINLKSKFVFGAFFHHYEFFQW